VTSPWQRLSRSPLRAALAATFGAIVGGLYAHFIGCKTGTCPITSSIWSASLYGALVGALAGWPSRPVTAQADADASDRG